jgi:hypothetical protein
MVAIVTVITKVTDVSLLLWLRDDARRLSLCDSFIACIVGFICLICLNLQITITGCPRANNSHAKQ